MHLQLLYRSPTAQRRADFAVDGQSGSLPSTAGRAICERFPISGPQNRDSGHIPLR